MSQIEQQLVEEWRKFDPFLVELDSFQKFCDIKLMGSSYPHNPEDLFFTVELARKEVLECIGLSRGISCIPKEDSEDYWKRNNVAANAVRALVALHSKADQTDWPLHLDCREQHLAWIKGEFDVDLAELDFEAAWALFEHKQWFSNKSGYYIRGWLAVAEALGVGNKAREILELTPFPHADKPRKPRDRICERKNTCPIYQFKEWLMLTPIDIPEDVFNYPRFHSNCDYYLHGIEKFFKEGNKKEVLAYINRPATPFRVRWKIRRMIRDYQCLPKCKNCGAISYMSYRFGCESYYDYLKKWKGIELCWTCQKLVMKVYETKINPLRSEGQYGIPEDIEENLRRKLIAGDELFADV